MLRAESWPERDYLCCQDHIRRTPSAFYDTLTEDIAPEESRVSVIVPGISPVIVILEILPELSLFMVEVVPPSKTLVIWPLESRVIVALTPATMSLTRPMLPALSVANYRNTFPFAATVPAVFNPSCFSSLRHLGLDCSI